MAPRPAKCFALLLAAALAVLVACTPEPSRETVERELLDADLAFLQATTQDGLEGWLRGQPSLLSTSDPVIEDGPVTRLRLVPRARASEAAR